MLEDVYKEVIRRYKDKLRAALTLETLERVIPRASYVAIVVSRILGVGLSVEPDSRRGKVRKKRRVESDDDDSTRGASGVKTLD